MDALADGAALVADSGTILWANARLGAVAGRRLGDVLPGVELKAGDQWVALPSGVPGAVTMGRTDTGWTLLVKDLRPWVGEAGGRPPPRAMDLDRALGAAFRGALRASRDELETEDRPEEIARVLAVQGTRLIRDADCVIALVEPGRPGVIHIAGAEGPWASTLLGRHLPLPGSFVEQSMLAQQTVETSRAQGVSVHSALLAGGDIQTMRLVPVVASQRLPDGRVALGTIGFYSRRPKPFSRLQRTLIDDFASLVSLSLQRAALLRAVRVTARRLEVAIELAVDISASLDEREVVRRMLDRLLETVAAERAALLRIDAGETVVEDSRDVLGIPDVIGYRMPVAMQPLMAEAISSQRPVVGGAYDRGALPAALQRALSGVRHTLSVPLVLSGEVIAVVVLSRRRDVEFGADEVATTQLVGNLAALALRNSWLYAEAQEALRIKSDFLNMAAHELRTPLTVVTGYMSLLRDGNFGPAPAAWKHPVEMLDAKAGELGRLVEDLLLTARLESGGLPVHKERVDLRAAALAAVRRAGPRAELMGAHIEAEAAEGMLVEADRDHLGRILDNLLNNALTYSRGTAEIRLRVRRRPEGPAVEVEDHGRGIPALLAARIFERFYRIDDEGYPQQPGTGLGLYISRELALRQDARLWLDWSEVGQGSRFVISFPEPAA